MRSGRQRASAKRQTVVRVVDGVEEPRDVLVARHYARQAKYREWRIVRMYTHVHAVLVAYGHYRREEVAHVLAQLLLRYTLIQVEQLTEQLYGVLVVLGNVAVDEALRLYDDVLHQLVVVLSRHHRLQPLHLGHHLGSVVLLGALTLQYAAVEISKLRMAEIQVARAVGIRMGKIRTRPVEHRHEVVAHRVHALKPQILQALLVVLYQLVTVRPAVLYALAYGQALHHRPAHAVALDILSEVTYLLARPHLAVRHVMKGRHYALNAYLLEHGQRNLVVLTEPSPCLFHSYNVFLLICFMFLQSIHDDRAHPSLSCTPYTAARQTSALPSGATTSSATAISCRPPARTQPARSRKARLPQTPRAAASAAYCRATRQTPRCAVLFPARQATPRSFYPRCSSV